MKEDNSLYQFQSQKFSQFSQPFFYDLIRFRIILSWVGKNQKVLELGSSFPSFTRALIKQKNDVLGLDISPRVVRRTQRTGVKALVCNLETDPWPVKKNSFAVVVAGEIIEHLLDTDRFLKNIYQVLRPQGRLILSTPNTASLGRRLALLIGKNPELETGYHPSRAGHVRYFVKDSLFILLKKHGFAIEKFTSEVVLFNQNHSLYSTKLAHLFPTLGKSLIIQAKKVKHLGGGKV